MPKDNKDLLGKKAIPTPKEKPQIGIDTTKSFENDILDAFESSTLDINALNSFTNVAQTREEVYSLIDTMSQDDAVSSVLETYTEDAVETNDNGKVVWCESSNENVAKYVTYLLDSINVDKNVYTWTYNLIKYGDVYLKLYRESDYGDDLLFGTSSKDSDRTVNESVDLNVSSPNDHYVHYAEMVSNPGEMFELTRFGKTVGYIKAPVNIQNHYDQSTSLNQYLTYKMKPNDVTVFGATEFVHACLTDKSDRNPEEVEIFMSDDDLDNNKVASTYKVRRGQSLLYNSFKVWRQLSLLENSVMLNRLTKSAIVRVLNVDVGDMPKEQVNNFMQRLKQRIEQKSAINANNSMTEYTNPGPIENIIYVPTHGTQGTIQAQSIGGDVDTDQLIDLGYFQDKFYGSLRAPKQYFGITDDSTGFNGGSSLSIISSRYGKAVKQIQNVMCQAITDLINLYLIDKGLTNYINKFTIRMQSPITQEELDKRENMRNRVGVVGDIMGQLGNVVTDDVIKAKMTKALLSDCISNPDVIQLLQDQIDKLEEEKENGEQTSDDNNSESEIDFGGDNLPTSIDMEDVGEPLSSSEETSEESNIDTGSESESEQPTIEEPQEEISLQSPDELGIDMTDNIGNI